LTGLADEERKDTVEELIRRLIR